MKKAYRELNFRAKAKNDGTYDLSFASGNIVDMGFYQEILHIPGCNFGRLNNKAQLLFNHQRDNYIGVINNAWIEGNIAMANVSIGSSERCNEFKKDIDDGILNKISVGYYVDEETHDKDNDIYTATRWTPFEISVVTIPADDAVGLRSREEKCKARFNQPLEKFKIRSNNMKEAKKEAQAETKQRELGEETIAKNAINLERTRISKIQKMALKLKTPDEYRDSAINNGVSLIDFIDNAPEVKNEVQKERTQQTPTSPKLVGEISTRDDDDALAFRFTDLLRDMTNHKNGDKYSRSYEMACGGGSKIVLPNGLMSREASLRNQIKERASLTTSASLIGNDVQGIEQSLQNALILDSLGCRIYMGLRENITIPVSNRVYAASFVATGTANDGVSGDYAAKQLSPKRLTLDTELGKKLILNSTPSIENDLRMELFSSVGRAWQNAVFSGSGSGENPTGITNTTGVSTLVNTKFAPATITKDILTGLEVLPRKANIRGGQTSYVMSEQTLADMTNKLLTTGDAKYLAEYINTVDASGKMATGRTATGQTIYTTEALPTASAGSVIYGHWDNVSCGFWENITMNVDSISHSVASRGMIAFSIEAYADTIVTRPKAFVTTS